MDQWKQQQRQDIHQAPSRRRKRADPARDLHAPTQDPTTRPGRGDQPLRETEPHLGRYQVGRHTSPGNVRQTTYGMNMHDFLQRTSSYESRQKRAVAFSPLLRRATHIGMLFTLISIFIATILPAGTEWLPYFFFPWLPARLNMLLLNYLHWLGQLQWLLGYDFGFMVVSGSILLIWTRNLRRGVIGHHGLAFIHVVVGCVNLLLVLLPLAIIIANIFVWCLIILCLYLLIAALLRMARR